MGRLTFITVLALLYLQWADGATLIRKGTEKDREFVFGYVGVVKAKNTVTETLTSAWSIEGKLTLQSKGNDIVMKFDDIKNGLFAGDIEGAASAKPIPSPEEAHHLSLPFVVHYYENGSVSSLSHQPDDPLWSVNMKRAIASIIQLDTEHLNDLNGTNHFEESIYGNCEAEYLMFENYNGGDEDTSTFTVSKQWNDTSCAGQLDNSWSNMVRAPTTANNDHPTQTQVRRNYRIQLDNTDSAIKKIDVMSRAAINFYYNERSHHRLEQSQDFNFVHIRDIVTPIDVTKITKSTSLVYVFDEDESSGRQPKRVLDQEKLIQDLSDSYAAFKADLQRSPLVPGDIGINNTLLSIANTLRKIDQDSIDLTAFAALFSGDKEMKGLLVSMLPYMATKESVELVRLVIEKKGIDDLSLIKLMATFPRYVDEYTPELFKKMEVLLSLNVECKHVKHTGILSFANLVAEAHVKIGKPEKYLQEYANKFLEHYRKASNNENKMVYLLGVINVGALLDADVLISIIESKDESHYIRTLAAYGFKPYLISNGQELFKRLSTIVFNADEHFEVRVAVLDVLMSSNLTKTQFDTIINHFEKSSNDPVQKHLQNYLSTTLLSLQNTTKYNDYLGAMATDLSVTIPSYYETWTTGNYRIGYTDAVPTFGRYFQASLIANPITNAINVMQLSSNQFAMSMNLGAYSLYLRLDGVADYIFSEILKSRDASEIGIPELVEILTKFNYKHTEERNMHVEVVVFSDYRVVFGMQINRDNLYSFLRNPMILDVLKQLGKYESVTYPKMYFDVLRSDLGTPVKIDIIETNLVSYQLVTNLDELRNKSVKVKTGEVKFRTSHYEMINLVSYNPLADVSISTYRYKSHAQRLDIPISLNTTGGYVSFENHDDAYNYVQSRSIGVTVDDAAKLKEYCSACEADVQLPHLEPETKLMKLEEIGLKLNLTYARSAPISGSYSYNPEFEEVYNSNSLAIPLAEPLLMLLCTTDYYQYIGPNVNIASLRTKSYLSTPIKNWVEWTFDIDNIYEGKDPINGTHLFVGVKVTSLVHPDPDVFSSVRATYAYSSAPVINTKDGGSHVEQKHKFRADYTDSHVVNLICVDRELQYPSRRPDMLSISPVEPAIGKGRISVGKSDDSYACSNDFSITFSDIYEMAENQMETVKNKKEYEKCKKESAGLKYTPPTDACLDVHDAVSKYNKYMLFVDLKNAGHLSKIYTKLGPSDRGLKFLEYNYIDGDLANVKLTNELVDVLPFDFDKMLDFNTSLGVFNAIENPTSVAYGGDDAIFGISSICDITPSKINTFTGTEIDNYQAEDGKEAVAYIECFNASRNGLTIQKFSDKTVGFTMWSHNDKLIVSLPEGKLKVQLNGEDIHKQHTSSRINVYFLADDVIYVTNDDFQVYYNTEYISIKTLSIYNNYICGLCAPDRKI